MGEGEEVGGPSAALTAFDGLRNMINLSFNNPALPSPDGVTDYSLTLPTSLRSTLEDVKADIAKYASRPPLGVCALHVAVHRCVSPYHWRLLRTTNSTARLSFFSYT
jgi:hypothetical protein